MHEVHVQSCDMVFISYFGNPKDFNFQTVVFLAEWFVCLFFFHVNPQMLTFFHSAQHCVYCVESHGLIFILNIREASVTVR